jgi:hypothetical protein
MPSIEMDGSSYADYLEHVQPVEDILMPQPPDLATPQGHGFEGTEARQEGLDMTAAEAASHMMPGVDWSQYEDVAALAPTVEDEEAGAELPPTGAELVEQHEAAGDAMVEAASKWGDEATAAHGELVRHWAAISATATGTAAGRSAWLRSPWPWPPLSATSTSL